jgi:hypothetical protein
MRDEIQLLRDARPDTTGPTPEVTRGARASLMADIADTRRPARWRRRRVVRIAAPAFAAAVAAIVLGLTLTGKDGEQAWAAALVRVAEAAPRLLVGEEGWEIERADQFSVDYGEMTFEKDGRELDIKWTGAGEFAAAVSKRDSELDDLGTAAAADGEARLFRYRGTDEYVAVWVRGDYMVEARGRAPDIDAFKSLLASLHEVDVDSWLSAMPESVVKPARQAETVDEMLAGVPLPPGFDPSSIPTTDAVRDRYQLGALVAGSVACAWIDRWVAARRAGDDAGAREAVDAMATSRTWNVLQAMDAEGDYPEVVWELASAMETNGTVPAGLPMTVEESYEDALGCPS